jgi:hypothetical protein
MRFAVVLCPAPRASDPGICRFLWQRVESLNHVVQLAKQKAILLVRLGTVFGSIFG